MRELFRLTLTSRRFPIWARYATTTILVALALWAELAWGGDLRGHPFLLLFPAIILSGVVFDRGTAFYATLLGAALIAYFFLPPHRSFGIEEARDVVGLAVFITTGILTALLIEALHGAYVDLAEAHDRLDSTARDRAVLLQELSHRMRNDLAAVASLLSLQAKALPDPAGRAALLAASDRIYVLARVHQRLTTAEGAAVVDSKEFIDDLCHDLDGSLVGFRPVALSVFAESHPITLRRAVALGLIINELLTNALKHAFPDGRAGHLEVQFQKQSADFCLRVRDNGVGLNGAVRGAGMGQELVRALATSLGGRALIADAQPGLEVKIMFPADPDSPSGATQAEPPSV
jgi:two-component sensor histidine kinase